MEFSVATMEGRDARIIPLNRCENLIVSFLILRNIAIQENHELKIPSEKLVVR